MKIITSLKESIQKYKLRNVDASFDYHATLQRQIKKYLKKGDLEDKTIQKFLLAVSETYKHFDEDRALAERSLELGSKELRDANTKLQKKIEVLDDRSSELEKMNKVMIGRELRMVDLKKKIKEMKELLEQHNVTSSEDKN